MPSAGDFFKAFSVVWNASALASQFTGPIADLAPPDTPFPYVVFSSVHNFRIGTTSESQFWKYPFDLKIFDQDRDSNIANVEAIKAVFNQDTIFTLVGGGGVGSVLLFRCIDERYTQDDKGVDMAVLSYVSDRTMSQSS